MLDEIEHPCITSAQLSEASGDFQEKMASKNIGISWYFLGFSLPLNQGTKNTKKNGTAVLYIFASRRFCPVLFRHYSGSIALSTFPSFSVLLIGIFPFFAQRRRFIINHFRRIHIIFKSFISSTGCRHLVLFCPVIISPSKTTRTIVIAKPYQYQKERHTKRNSQTNHHEGRVLYPRIAIPLPFPGCHNCIMCPRN
jgi:hypothetical protein